MLPLTRILEKRRKNLTTFLQENNIKTIEDFNIYLMIENCYVDQTTQESVEKILKNLQISEKASIEEEVLTEDNEELNLTVEDDQKPVAKNKKQKKEKNNT